MTESSTRGIAVLLILGLALSSAAGQESNSDGAALFAQYCASCHGPIGEGDGPVASVMAVTVPNLRTLTARSGGEFPREAVMRYIDGRELPAAHGDRLMPVWGETFAAAQDESDDGEATARRRISAITDFVEQLQR